MHILSKKNLDFFCVCRISNFVKYGKFRNFLDKKLYSLYFIFEQKNAVEMHTNFNKNDDF